MRGGVSPARRRPSRSALRCSAIFSAKRRLLVKNSVERLASITSRKLPASGPQIFSPLSAAARAAGGNRTESSMRLAASERTMPTRRGRPSRPLPPTQAATSSNGRTVAERARRWNSPAISTNRSKPVVNCAPRRFSTKACTSSTTTVSTVPSACLPLPVESSKSKLSGVVMSNSGGRRSRRRRSAASVSPVRTPTRTVGNSRPQAQKRVRISAMGASRLARMSLPSALSGEM